MTTRIEGLGPLPGGPEKKGLGRSEGTSPSFGDLLKEQIGKVNEMQLDADRAIEDLATGRTDNVAEVMTAVQKADLAFKTMMQIRNKLLNAYREISRMQT